MHEPPPAVAGTSTRPETIRRSMGRTMTATGVILVMVAALAAGAVWLAWHAGTQQRRAETAERDSQEQLWRAQVERAAALRRTGMAGARAEGLALLKQAMQGGGASAGVDDTLRLRDEAAALLALPDAAEDGMPLPLPEKDYIVAVNTAAGLFATGAQDAEFIPVRRLNDGGELMRLILTPKFPASHTLLTLEWRPGAGGTAQLAAGFKTGAVAIWEIPSGKLFMEWHPPAGSGLNGGPLQAGFSADGKQFAWFGTEQGPLMVQDLEKNERVPHSIHHPRGAFALRPGGREIALAVKEEVRLLNPATGAARRTWTCPVGIQHLAWSPDGQMLAAMLWSGQVRLWNLAGGDDVVLNGHTGEVRAMQFSPDGRLLMTSSRDSTTRWWDTRRGHLLLTGSAGTGLAWMPEGEGVVAEGNDHRLVRWRFAPSPVLHTAALGGGRNWDFRAFDLSPDGNWCAALSPAGIHLWEPGKPGVPESLVLNPFIIGGSRLVKNILGRVMLYTGLAFEPDGTLLVMVDGAVLRRKITALNGMTTLTPATPDEIPLPKGMTARTAAVSPAGGRALVEFMDTRMALVSLTENCQPVPLPAQQNFAFNYGPGSPTGAGRFVLSGDGRFAVVGYGVGTGVSVFDAADGKALPVTNAGGLAQFSPDSSRLILCRQREVEILRTRDWTREQLIPLPGQHGTSSGAAFTGDGKLLALADTPQTIQLRRGDDLTRHVTLVAPVPQTQRGCRLSHNGAQLAIALGSNEMQFWNLCALRQQLAALGLDWNDAGPAATGVSSARLANSSPPWLLAAALAGASLAAGAAAVFLLRRHRRLIRSYADAEMLVERQQHDLERANASLLHSQKMKALGTLAAGMAHDFNNLLSVIRMSGKLISREAPGDEGVKEHTDAIEHAVLQGKQVVRSMLGYSRPASGHGPQSAAAAVDDAVVLLSTEFLSGIALTLDLDRNCALVTVTGGSIEQILLNLVVNASEAMNGRGSLTITVRTAAAPPRQGFLLAPRSAAPWVEICVRDSGPGIEAETAARIFEPFFTTKNAGNQRGTGLGLSMVHTIAEQEGLGLALDSTPGHGAAFSVYLPPVRESPTARAQNAA